ncbi:hypothetical protein Goarm_008674, partial [Gossypium armourianum]|nr:hypothetical protein [Gossypium armourianum]
MYAHRSVDRTLNANWSIPEELYHQTFSFQVIVPHGEPVTVDTFSQWRERFEAELALERA